MNQEEYVNLQEDNYTRCLDISRHKCSDYAGDTDPFRNFRLAAMIINRPVHEVMLSRMAEKIIRVSNVLEKAANGKNPAVNETAQETLDDLIVYPNLLKIWLQQEQDEKLLTDKTAIVETLKKGVAAHYDDCQCVNCVFERQQQERKAVDA